MSSSKRNKSKKMNSTNSKVLVSSVGKKFTLSKRNILVVAVVILLFIVGIVSFVSLSSSNQKPDNTSAVEDSNAEISEPEKTEAEIEQEQIDASTIRYDESKELSTEEQEQKLKQYEE